MMTSIGQGTGKGAVRSCLYVQSRWKSSRQGGKLA